MTTVDVDTPQGPARVHVHRSGARGRPRLSVVLGHGAGGGVQARDLQALAVGLTGPATSVLLVEQPWRVAGRRVAPAPPRLDEAWLAILGSGAFELAPRVVVGGRSAGARVACRTAAAAEAAAVLALAFPLHPPGRPERSRQGELRAVEVPLLVLQGERDPFGGPGEFPPDVALRAVPSADHGFAVPARAPVTQDEALTLMVSAAGEWIRRLREEARGGSR